MKISLTKRSTGADRLSSRSVLNRQQKSTHFFLSSGSAVSLVAYSDTASNNEYDVSDAVRILTSSSIVKPKKGDRIDAASIISFCGLSIAARSENTSNISGLAKKSFAAEFSDGIPAAVNASSTSEENEELRLRTAMSE